MRKKINKMKKMNKNVKNLHFSFIYQICSLSLRDKMTTDTDLSYHI